MDAATTTACLNCGTALSTRHCPYCGQKARVHRSLRGFAGDILAGLFNFEGKFWRTLPMLVWNPGTLTRCFVDGQRVRFISPAALYLFTVFLMFAALSFTEDPKPINVADNIGTVIKRQETALDKQVAERDRLASAGQPTATLDAAIAERRRELTELRSIKLDGSSIRFDGVDELPPWARDRVNQAVKDPERAIAKVQEAASKFSWLLIPLSVPAVWLLFPLRRRHLFDHTVFVTYSLSFMMLLVVISTMLTLAGATTLAGFLALVPPLHMYRQLRGAYALGRAAALIRTLLLLLAATFVLIVWAGLIMMLGLLT